MPTIVTSAARTTSSDSGTLPLSAYIRDASKIKSAVLLLTVSAAATAAGDLLDVYVQQSPDGGTTWDDFIHFTQVLGNGGAKKFVATWSSLITPESELHAPADASLAAGVLQGPVSPVWRVKWVITSASAPSFTFKVDAQFVLGGR